MFQPLPRTHMTKAQRIEDKARKSMSTAPSLDQFLELMAGSNPRKERTSEAMERRKRDGEEPSAHEVWQAMIAANMPNETQLVWRKCAFLEAYVECGTKSGACRVVHTNLDTLRKWELRDPSFKAALDLATENVVDDLEEEAIRRGKEKSDNLLIFMLKNKRPKEFTEKTETKHTFAMEGARQKLKAQLGEMAHRKQLAKDNSIGIKHDHDLEDLVEIVE